MSGSLSCRTSPAHGGYPGKVFYTGTVCPYCREFAATDIREEVGHMRECHQDVIDERLRQAGLLDPYSLSSV